VPRHIFVTVSVITVLAICVFGRDTEYSFNLCVTFPAEAITKRSVRSGHMGHMSVLSMLFVQI